MGVVNYWAVLVCGLLSMGIGAIWYGPLFGKKWMEICGATFEDLEARKKMQKAAGPLYVVQFLLALLQIWFLATYITGWGAPIAVLKAFGIWLAFVMPTVAGASMWNNDSSKIKWARFLIQSGYQLVNFIVFGLLLGMWN